jgi:hypothetical protein
MFSLWCFRKSKIEISHFIFPILFRTFIAFPLFSGFLVSLGKFFWVYLSSHKPRKERDHLKRSIQ